MAAIGYPASRTTVLMYAHPSMHNLARSIVKICSDPAGRVDALSCESTDKEHCSPSVITPKDVST